MPPPLPNETDCTIRIVVADDHSLVRGQFAAFLDAQPDMEVVGQADDGRLAFEVAEAVRPNVVLMDINMPNVDGIEATRKLAKLLPEIRVIGFSMHGDAMAATMIEAGASACMAKSGSLTVLLAEIRSSTGITPRA